MDGSEKLARDLVVLEAMAAEMDEYLRRDVLFWPLRGSDLPRLTLGGYLMRQHRLLQLRDLLSMAEQERLHAAIKRYHEGQEEKIVRLEKKAHEELEARIRQWREYLNEVKGGSSVAYYPSAVDTRAMIRALVNQLRISPYQLNEEVPSQIALLDRELSRIWESGDFVWPFDWQPAYPREEYWWLYGRPRERTA
ncbi:MAG: hypothetical protein GX579_13425 [Chloroflexi bacterium]|nr:hypothetical protein [Chloroflexota bacterium]